jgi:hypothetical protein
MIIKAVRSRVIFILAAGCLVASLPGCHKSDESNQEGACVDALCYPGCETMRDELYEDQDYMVVHLAYCEDEDYCNCNFGCDNDACEAYCRKEKAMPMGYCDILSCVCMGDIPDGGDGGDGGR